MSRVGVISKIVWAVDPYLDTEESQDRIVKALRALAVPFEATISPVAVLVGDEGEGAPPFLPGAPKELHAIVERRLEAFLKSCQLPRLLSPILLTQERESIREAVDVLLHHVHQLGGDLIAVSTHSRRGMERFLMGSFAETLLLRSDIPTLTVGPHTRPVEQIREVLFPTDFSEKSRQALDKVLPLVQALGAKLILYHHADLFPETFAPIDPGPAYFKALEDHEVWEKEQLDALGKELDRSGVRVEAMFGQEGASTAEMILEIAGKMHDGIIAMASQSGPVGSTLLGSVTRQVVRASPCPVWVVHPGGRQK